MRARCTLTRVRAVVGLGVAQLRHAPGRTALSVAAVVVAVLAVTLLAGLGIGVLETGQEELDESGRDIWITGGPSEPAAAENDVVDAQTVAAEIREREDVGDVSTIALHHLYVGPNPDDVERVTAVGIQGTHTHYEFEDGSGFEGEAYADATATQPSPVVVHPELADQFDLEVGDTVSLGASALTTRPYTVVGIGSYYAQFLGTETVTVPLEEVQHMTGTAGSDRAAFITVNIADGADRATVRDDLRTAYPAYDIRTSDDQLAAMVTDRILVLASGLTLIGLAIAGGIALTANVFMLVAYQQRETLTALRALGLSRWLLAGIIGVQGTLIGFVGGSLGLAATPLVARVLNRVSTAFFGYEHIVRPTADVYGLGLAIALVVGTLVAVLTGWQASRLASSASLEP